LEVKPSFTLSHQHQKRVQERKNLGKNLLLLAWRLVWLSFTSTAPTACFMKEERSLKERSGFSDLIYVFEDRVGIFDYWGDNYKLHHDLS
jgi:hypothetical protein